VNAIATLDKDTAEAVRLSVAEAETLAHAALDAFFHRSRADELVDLPRRRPAVTLPAQAGRVRPGRLSPEHHGFAEHSGVQYRYQPMSP
jgi:hypothetical protein